MTLKGHYTLCYVNPARLCRQYCAVGQDVDEFLYTLSVVSMCSGLAAILSVVAVFQKRSVLDSWAYYYFKIFMYVLKLLNSS